LKYCEVKNKKSSKQEKTQQNSKRKAKQNKWTSRKAASRTWAGGCANRRPFPDFFLPIEVLMQGQKPKSN